MLSLVTGRRTAWAFAAAPLLLALFVLVLIGEGERQPTPVDALPDGFDSTRGTALLEQLPDEASTLALVLFTSENETLSRAEVKELSAVAKQLHGDAAGGQQQGPPLILSDDGTAGLVAVPVPAGSATRTADRVEALRVSADEAAPSGVEAQVTGPAAVEADLAAVFDGADGTLLQVTALVVAVLLIITYRSPVLWVVPLVVVGTADRLAAVVATQVMAALDVAWDESTIGILSVLVFGAGTDYALLLISRYRDELRQEESRGRAMDAALRRTAEAVSSSAVTVVLGLLTLLLSLIPTTRGLGLACAIGIVVAAGFALVVLPAALVVCGRWIFWPRIPRTAQSATEAHGLWQRVGRVVGRAPVAVSIGSAVVLSAMAFGVFSIDLGLDQSEQFLEKPEAISAAERLAESFPAGTSDPVPVVTPGDQGAVLEAVRGVPGVENAGVGSSGGGVSVVNAVLSGAPGTNGATIERMRDAVGPLGASVTGSEAIALDAEAAADRDLRLIVPIILGLVVISLMLLLRSLVAPVLLVATVVMTYVASMGVSWWVFRQVLGFEAMDSGVPLLAFLFLVALGVDYNIFLVTGAREESRWHGTRRGMLRALAATGGVITSAGILLAAVFLVLGVLPLVVLAQLGTVICIGVLLDTLLVRTLLVPALGVLLGDRFWWPRRLSMEAPPPDPSSRDRARAGLAGRH